jgi:hypothetical protein
MKQNNNSQDSIDLPLTEEKYEQAHEEVQIRSDLEVNAINSIVKRDDVKKVFDMRAGYKNRQYQARDNIADERLRILLYKIPSKDEQEKYLYRVEGPVEIAHREILEGKPKHHIIVEDAYDFVEHSYEEHDKDIDDCYEFIKAEDDKHGKWNDLAKKVADEYRTIF